MCQLVFDWGRMQRSIGLHNNPPVLAQHAEQGALSSTENVLPRHGVLAWNLDRSVGIEPVDEPSLSGEPECLSLHGYILPQAGKLEMQTQPKPQIRTRIPLVPWNGTGLLLGVLRKISYVTSHHLPKQNKEYVACYLCWNTSTMRKKKSCTVTESISPEMASAALLPPGQHPK